MNTYKLINVMFIKLYLDYDLELDFLPQFTKNADICVKTVKTILDMTKEDA